MFNNDNWKETPTTLQWRHNERNVVSNHQPHHCLLNNFSGAGKKKSTHRVIGLCAGNSPVTGEFPAQRASNAENIFIAWRHHGIVTYARGPIHSDGHVSRVSKPNSISWITKLIAIFRITPYRGNLLHNGVYGPQCIQLITSVRPSARGFGFIEYIDMVIRMKYYAQ